MRIISKKLTDLSTDRSFEIPPVQRGLVWEPGQVMALWDSLSKGYPIGSFLAYGDPDKKLQLLDGQQRYNAICMGTQIGEETPQATLWVREGNNQLPVFMVCTTCHPWGFNEDGSVFSASIQAEANKKFLPKKEKEEFADCFIKAKLKRGFPWMDQGVGFVPLPVLFHADFETKWESSMQLLSEKQKEIVSELRQSDWFKRIKAAEIPVLLWAEEIKSLNTDLEELFTRINKGGSPLSSIDQRYSSICVYLGVDIKKKNNSLANEFLPPERLATLAARISYAEVENKWVEDIPPTTLSKWFKEDSKCASKLRGMYCNNELEDVKGSFKKLCKVGEIPSCVYLSSDDSWLWNILWTIYHFELTWRDDNTKKYFPLFCMLPYVMMGASNKTAINEFCRNFYDGIKYLKQGPPLLKLMAMGCAHAALYPECCMYPYPYQEKEKTDRNSRPYDDAQKWHECFTKYRGTANNPILHYYQRVYMNYLLEGSRFNPGMRAHWERTSNRPWDMDHIIPHDWWGKNKEDLRHHIGNMQVLDFQHNREKGARSAAVPLKDDESKWSEEWHRCLRDDEDGFGDRNIKEKGGAAEKNWEEKLLNRLRHIEKSVISELHLNDLIREINDLEKQEPDKHVSGPLKRAIHRYRFMVKVARLLKERHQTRAWGTVQFEWRRRQKSMEPLLTVPIPVPEPDADPDFYHSLTPDLSLGIPIEDKLLLAGLNWNASNPYMEMGLRRGLDVSLEEWRKRYVDKKAWWFSEEENFEEAIDNNCAEEIANRIVDLCRKMRADDDRHL